MIKYKSSVSLRLCVNSLAEKRHPLQKTGQPAPVRHQSLSGWRIPILLQIGVAARTLPRPVVVAKAAFQRHQSRAVQFAAVFFQEGAAVAGVNLQGKLAFAAPKGRRQYPERAVRGQLEHHLGGVTGLDGARRLRHRPPARTGAIAEANIAVAWFRRRILLGQCLFVPVFSGRQRNLRGKAFTRMVNRWIADGPALLRIRLPAPLTAR